MRQTEMLRVLIVAPTLIAGVYAAGAQQSDPSTGFPNSPASIRGASYPLGSQRGPAFPTVPVRPNPPLTPPASAKSLQVAPMPAVDNTLPLPTGALPNCPKWDWSSSAPPPMRPPFDRSKLYCPPPPFNPPSPPIGCICR